jgi:hypothetical protein
VYNSIINALEQRVSREEAIVNLIESITLEEGAVAHIIDTQGETLKKFLHCGRNTEELLQINRSINDTIKILLKLQMLLQSKLEYLKNILQK